MRRRQTRAETSPVLAAAPKEQEPITPEQLADLESAWGELRQAVEETGVTEFRACTIDGSRWQDDPESVRAMTAAILTTKDYTAEGPKDEPAR